MACIDTHLNICCEVKHNKKAVKDFFFYFVYDNCNLGLDLFAKNIVPMLLFQGGYIMIKPVYQGIYEGL